MTLIITYGNRDYITQLSDRRLTANGKLVEDESNKAATLFCANGRLAFGFTGLAKTFEFETRKWLLQALIECAPPNYTAKEMLDRLCERATNDFNSIPALVKTPKAYKRLSIMFSGYLHHHDPPLAVYAIMTNYQNFDNKLVNEARNQFTCSYWSEVRPNQDDFNFVQKAGLWTAFTDDDADKIRSLLKRRVPAKAVLDKSIEIIRKISERPIAGGLIGKQLSSITISRDITKNVESAYHSVSVKHESVMPDIVFAQGAKSHGVVENIKVEAVDPETTPPMVFPKVPKNQPCPCKSGRKYKHCHGKHKKN